ncbi:MAG: TatD family hydrolase [Elusimicrobia bacterium]|nr:TatD family hydrolase [Elusimicrobiota bacterium]
MKFIETHAHLSDKAFNDDRNEVINKSFSSGIEKIIEISCSAKDWQNALDLGENYKNKIFPVFGIYPGYIEELNAENLAKLQDNLKKDFCAGLGEIGLDYYWDNSKKKEQFKILDSMIDISNRLEKICVFHTRNGKDEKNDSAYMDLAAKLKNDWSFNNKKRNRGILHCFSGNWEDAKTGLDLGLLIGVNGTFTYKKNHELREIIKKAGIENIVLETDCPYLPPQAIRGQRNEPSQIPLIAQAISEYLSAKVEYIAGITSANANELFSNKPFSTSEVENGLSGE